MGKKKRERRKPKRDVIEAAGGLLFRNDNGLIRLAIVHRNRYDDWTLPKGRREKGESWEETAVREVSEETNCKVKLNEFAGCTCYTIRDIPKVVLFWTMDLKEENSFHKNEETDQILWLSRDQALEKISYSTERRLIADRWQI